MSLFNKKDNVPEIPSAPTLPELPKSNIPAAPSSMPTLPSMPNAPGHDNINQEIVKSAVSDSPEGNEVMHNAQAEHASFAGAGLPPKTEMPVAGGQKEIIYVKIDKFQNAQIALNEIKLKVTEISKEIADLKAVKDKETAEIDAWDIEMKTINQRLSKIDTGIFGEV